MEFFEAFPLKLVGQIRDDQPIMNIINGVLPLFAKKNYFEMSLGSNSEGFFFGPRFFDVNFKI